MDFSLNPEQRKWQARAREFAQDVLRPDSLRRDHIRNARETFDWDIVRQGSRLGFRTLTVPTRFGGHGADLITQIVVMIELARGDCAMSKTFTQCWKWGQVMGASCTEDQQARFLMPFVTDDTYLIGAGRTEHNGGSDNRLPPADDPTSGFKLRAERDGDEWLLNGEKCFIAHGGVAKLFLVHGRTNPRVAIREGSTLFLVPGDTPGFRIGHVFDKRGWRFYQNAELIFENARVPHANVVGEVNGGAKARNSDPSEFSDLELAATALGVADAAVEAGMARARSRELCGRRLIEHQALELKLSEMHMLTEALRSFVLRAAWERQKAVEGDAGYRQSINNILAMNFACDAVQRVTHLNMDIHAIEEGPMDGYADKLARDAAIWTHLAGDSINRMKPMRNLRSREKSGG